MSRIWIGWVCKREREVGKATHPLSPVARIKFFHLGCSQIRRAVSAVSVHQHSARLNSSLSAKRGRNVAMALRMPFSDASGYVSVGCFA